MLQFSRHTPYTGASCRFAVSNFWAVMKREPGVNPGLPRSGKQERTSQKALARKGWEAAASRFERFACKSEDLPVIVRYGAQM